MLRMGKKMSKIYPTNIYKLNKCALMIQHSFFKRMATPYHGRDSSQLFSKYAVPVTLDTPMPFQTQKSVPAPCVQV